MKMKNKPNQRAFRAVQKIRRRVSKALECLDASAALYDVYADHKESEVGEHCAKLGNAYIESAEFNLESALEQVRFSAKVKKVMKATEKVLRGILLMYEHPRVAEQIKSKQLEGITQSEADDVLRAVSWARRNLTVLENQKARQL